MCVQVEEILGLNCGENTAGVKTYNIIADEDLVFPLPAVDAAPADNTISTDVVLVDAVTAGFVEWKFLEFNASFSEEPAENGVYNVSHKLIIPKDDATKRNLFRKMFSDCCRYTLIVTDENGHTTLHPHMKFRDTFTTGQGGENNDRNQYDVEFYKSGRKGYTYTGTVPVQT